ncbi:DUF1861 family protein [Cohnella nanjingensis]|uniref:DUF1861 family protein n=1 Tax=Cohnella nanjingensis TaxID=1387779 RepID=A0A7X0VFM5_9BACL|nr:DUF1861 family protein [Cohnella nanjingensis]MBB6671981.1 DUF1861 family protein [Cohnella nanjingensis]
MLLELTQTQTCAQLIEAFERQPPNGAGEKLRFEGVDGRDVYNITAIFEDQGIPILAGRVEGRDTEFSEVVFFRQEGEAWVPHPDLPSYGLQDPFFTRIRDELIFGGVDVIADPHDPSEIVSWVTRLYRGTSLADLRLVFTGPDHMKDLRVVELTDGRIGVLTRPQGAAKGGRGQIGFFTVDALEHLTVQAVLDAPVYEDQFVREEWGGANEPRLLANGLIGVLGHIACYDALGDRHYYAMTFAIRPDTSERTAMKIIARRGSFPPGAAKRPDLTDVIFSGGLVRKPGGLADLYVGASDAEAYRIEIEDPFLEYERL